MVEDEELEVIELADANVHLVTKIHSGRESQPWLHFQIVQKFEQH